MLEWLWVVSVIAVEYLEGIDEERQSTAEKIE